jgi:hypothetical protein
VLRDIMALRPISASESDATMATSHNPVMTVATAVAIFGVALVGCNAVADSVKAIAGYYEATIGPFHPDEGDEWPLPRWIMLDSVLSASLQRPHPEGRYSARFPDAYDPEFLWDGGWQPFSTDSVRIDWNRTGATFEYRLAYANGQLNGKGIIHTDLRENVQTFDARARAVPCD